MRQSLTFIKKISLVLGAAGISVLVGVPAWAQSSSPSAAPEFELSNEGMKILCTVTPLNSRCEGSPYYSSGTSSQPVRDGASTSPSGTTAPTQNLPSESDVPSPQGQSPSGTMQDGTSPGTMPGGSPAGNGTTPPMGGSPAPVQNLPNSGTQDGGTPPTGTNGTTATPRGGTPAPVQNLPNSGTQDGGTPPPGTTTSPSGTTAPTQNLPSEGPNK